MTTQQTTVTRKGQITLPVTFRRRLGIDQGDQVEVEEQGDTLVIRRASSVTERTAGMMSRYALAEPLTADQERAAFEQAIASEVSASLDDE
jgi:AbrB family looped-hinge helix DNA binding protein